MLAQPGSDMPSASASAFIDKAVPMELQWTIDRGEVAVVAVAGHEVAAGLGDADDRPAGLQLGARQPVIQIALEIERGHAGIARIVPPQLAAQLGLVPCHRGSFPLKDAERAAAVP